MNKVQACLDFFEVLVKAYREGPLLSKVILQRAKKEQVFCIADVIVNTLVGNIPLPSSVQTELRRSKRILRKLSRVAQRSHNQQNDQQHQHKTKQKIPSRPSLFRKVCLEHYKTVVLFLRICLPHLRRVLNPAGVARESLSLSPTQPQTQTQPKSAALTQSRTPTQTLMPKQTAVQSSTSKDNSVRSGYSNDSDNEIQQEGVRGTTGKIRKSAVNGK